MSDEVILIFGDTEPEDAWHPDDPLEVLIDNLVRRAALLDRRRTQITRGDNPRHTLDDLAELVRRARRRRLYGRELVRADQLDEDIIYLRTRL